MENDIDFVALPLKSEMRKPLPFPWFEVITISSYVIAFAFIASYIVNRWLA